MCNGSLIFPRALLLMLRVRWLASEVGWFLFWASGYIFCTALIAAENMGQLELDLFFFCSAVFGEHSFFWVEILSWTLSS